MNLKNEKMFLNETTLSLISIFSAFSLEIRSAAASLKSKSSSLFQDVIAWLVVCGVLHSTPPRSDVLSDELFHFITVDCRAFRS
jgi:hypothetical protein